MKLGLGLPNTLTPHVNRKMLLDWARAGDQAGFSTFGTIDQPGYDSWDPLITLAAVAAVTERTRLLTSILQLPNRNEVVVAKQAAVIDQLSGGRMDLGVAVGGRESDFTALGARFAKRGKRFERQVRKIRKVWRDARKSTPEAGVTGPAPLQKKAPPIYIGGWTQPALRRAARMGDGFVFATVGPEMMGQLTPQIREWAVEAKRKSFSVGGIAYCAIGDDPRKALESGAANVLRYYRGNLWTEPENLIHHGPPEVIAEAVKDYEAAGLDFLILFPEIPDVRQVELLAENVLPSYR
ncbi:MAG: LLM class flavin-dependent oxidoreductase [Actinomycetota bacterium]